MIRAFAKSPSAVQASLLAEGTTELAAAPDPRFEQLRRLTEISRALTYTTSLDQVTRLTVERGCELLDATGAVLLLPTADGLLHVSAAHGVTSALLERFSAPLGEDLNARLQGLLSTAEDRLIAVPLIVGGEVTGVVAVATPQAFTSADEWLLSALADQSAVALENARVGGEVRLELEGRLRASEGATSAKDHALSTLAHDIRTPLGAIDAYCALLEDEIFGPVNDRQRETLGRVRMSGRHLLSLLDNVMEMARITAGALRLQTEPFRLVDATRDALQIVTPAADAKFQALTLSAQDPIVVTADEARVRQILVNLIGNAVKFTPADGRVSVTVARVVTHGSHWGEVRVVDSGPGIPDSEQKAIFEPYYRSEGTSTAPGVGLGLAICVGLIEQMGGRLLVESAPGLGSCFIALFPASE
jgi:phosphoserine phosphatase RsbU/P